MSTLAEALKEPFERAREVHAGIEVDRDRFTLFVSRHLPEGGTIDAIRIDALYLAFACATGDRHAIAKLERDYFRGVDMAVARLRGDATLTDEVRQMIRVRLLTAPPGKEPRITEYGGRGDLGRWLRAVAVRVAVDVLRSSGKETPVSDDVLADRATSGSDPEIELFKRRYGSEFRLAVHDAVRTLDVEARTDLRLYYVDGLTLEELSNLHEVTPSTISRRLGKARGRVLDETRSLLRDRLGVGDDDLESILRALESRLEIGESALVSRRG